MTFSTDSADFSGVFDEGVEDQAVAAPDDSGQTEENTDHDRADTKTEPGAEERDVADPAGEDGEGNEGDPEDKGQEQIPDDAAFAAARRKAERDSALEIARIREEARQEAQRMADEAIASTQITNPYTKQPVKSVAEIAEWKQRYEAEAAEQQLSEAGIERGAIEQIVANHPAVREAQAAAEKFRQQEERARDEAARVNIEAQIKEITAMNPHIKTLGDLLEGDHAEEVRTYVKRGYTFVDAYKLATFDQAKTKTAKAAKQAALNHAASKDHLTKSSPHGKGGVQVPPDQLALYRQLVPDATDEEIKKHYERHAKKKG